MDHKVMEGWILGLLEAVSICLHAGDETRAMEILKKGKIKRVEAKVVDFFDFELVDEYIESNQLHLPDWHSRKKIKTREAENMGQYIIKTIQNGWTRLENYCDCSVVAIKEFQGVCVTITNFTRFSIHGYSMDDIEKDEGDWRYILGEQILEQANGECDLKAVLQKYHLTDVEIAEVIHFDFDDRSCESYDLQAEWVRKNTDSLDCLSTKTFWYWATA
ncbi:hypothetical protein [Listeria monocytogenes]|uniref:hypothetical protein n=1 Tax=Listeria monocytogenes TaxID=1639 RepID=UPI00165D90D4|nr:hypothetical protein [Listeria monocytogenes]